MAAIQITILQGPEAQANDDATGKSEQQPQLSSSNSEPQEQLSSIEGEGIVTSKSAPELGDVANEGDGELDEAKKTQRLQRGRSTERMGRGQRQAQRDTKCEEVAAAKEEAAARKIQSVRRGNEERRKMSATYGERAPRSCPAPREPLSPRPSPTTPRPPLSPEPVQSSQAPPAHPRLSLPDACMATRSAPADMFTNQDPELVEQAEMELTTAAQKIQTRHRSRMSLRAEERAAQKAKEMEKQNEELRKQQEVGAPTAADLQGWRNEMSAQLSGVALKGGHAKDLVLELLETPG